MKSSAKQSLQAKKLVEKIISSLELCGEFKQALKKIFRNGKDGLIKLSEAERDKFSKLLNEAWECMSGLYINSETEPSGYKVCQMKYKPESGMLEFHLSATDKRNPISSRGYSLDVRGCISAQDWHEMRNCMHAQNYLMR